MPSGYVYITTIGDGSIYVQDNGPTAQIIVEVGLGAMTNADLTEALAGKEDDLGNPSTSGWVLHSTKAGVRYWAAAYTHPSYTAIDLPSLSNKVIKSIKSDATGHLIDATQADFDTYEGDMLTIADGDTEDLLVGDRMLQRQMIVDYVMSSDSNSQAGTARFIVSKNVAELYANKFKTISGVTLSKYVSGTDLYLRIVNNSGDTLYFDYTLKQNDK